MSESEEVKAQTEVIQRASAAARTGGSTAGLCVAQPGEGGGGRGGGGGDGEPLASSSNDFSEETVTDLLHLPPLMMVSGPHR